MVISPKAKVDALLNTKKGRRKNLGTCSLIPSINEIGICKSFGMGTSIK
jgi:hypothetical protein